MCVDHTKRYNHTEYGVCLLMSMFNCNQHCALRFISSVLLLLMLMRMIIDHANHDLQMSRKWITILQYN